MKVNNKTQIKLKEKTVIAILAPWCGYCTELKESGMLNEVSKKGINVIEISDEHIQAKELMGHVKSKSYPTIGIYKNGKLTLFKKPRSVKNITGMFKHIPSF